MSTGDTVVFSIDHYAWLVMSGRWPAHQDRMDVTGKVTAVGERGGGTRPTRPACVRWSDGKQTWHFVCNLELVPS